jgi:hypothetical protein
VDNIKMDLREAGWVIMGSIDLAKDKALVKAVMYFRVSLNFSELLTS